jgi:RNAse (barnase) inhibitor barstar
MQKREFQIDGTRFSDLQGFFDQISEHLIPGAEWGRNLDAFNDILRGGFGMPDEGFILVWLNSAESKKRLGYDETQRQLERRLQRSHPTNRNNVAMDLRKPYGVTSWISTNLDYLLFSFLHGQKSTNRV